VAGVQHWMRTFRGKGRESVAPGPLNPWTSPCADTLQPGPLLFRAKRWLMFLVQLRIAPQNPKTPFEI